MEGATPICERLLFEPANWKSRPKPEVGLGKVDRRIAVLQLFELSQH